MRENIDKDVIVQMFHEKYFDDIILARSLIKKLDYKNDPNLLVHIATSYFDEGKLRLAERYAFKAITLDPLNSRVLWILALIKWDYGQFDNAIFCFQEIIRIGTKRIDKCGIDETKEIAIARINDSKLQLYRLLINDLPSVAKRYLKQYEKGRQNGTFTMLDFYYQQIKLEISPT
jgi:tetratricopeptide (TPR) repeat protein